MQFKFPYRYVMTLHREKETKSQEEQNIVDNKKLEVMFGSP